MAHTHTLACLSCGRSNRVPAERLSENPRCGVCGAQLIPDKPVAIDPDILARARKADTLPLVVDFWAPWCGPCRMMAPEFEKAAAALKGTARLAKLDTQAHPQGAAGLGIRGIPTLIAFRAGREIARRSGAMPAAMIETFVREAALQQAG